MTTEQYELHYSATAGDLDVISREMRHVQEISLNFSTAGNQASQAFADLTRLVSAERLQDRSQLLFPRLAIRELPKTGVTLTVDGDQKIAFPTGKAHPAQELLELSELVRHFKDHVVRVDHMGINLPSDDIPGRELLNLVSQHAHVYEYPTGDPWYFVIPATADEFDRTMTDFSKIRFRSKTTTCVIPDLNATHSIA